MFGTILKYTAVLTLGGIGFACAGNWMDDEIIQNAKADIDNYRLSLNSNDVVEIKALTDAYINTHRHRWVDGITFASNLKQLNLILNSYN